MKKRLLSLLMALVMLLGLMPVTAFAGGETVISEVEVWGLDIPVVDMVPDWEAELHASAAYTLEAPEYSAGFINGIRYYDMEEERFLEEGDVFREGHTYEVAISLKAKDGYSFDAPENITTMTNLYKDSCAMSFYGIDPTRYVTVSLGTLNERVNLTPVRKNTISTENCIAYNEDGYAVDSAVEGEIVTVRARNFDDEPKRFSGWSIEPYIEYESIGEEEISFTMPGERVSVTAIYVTVSNQAYAINVMGGTAYDSDGNVITEAIPGTVVTLVADEPGFGWKFDGWWAMGESVDIADLQSETTTMVMPDYDVVVMTGYTEAERVPVEKLEFIVRGYYIGANVNCLQVEASGGAMLENVATTGLEYALFRDNNGKPANTPTTSGTISANGRYWIGMLLTPEFGYTLDGLTAAQIVASNAEDMILSVNSSGETILLLKLKAPLALLGGAKRITVTNGVATVNNTVVNNAGPNVLVCLTANEAPAGQYFYRWNVVSGNMVLEDPYSPIAYFTMGTSEVEVEAVYASPICEVAVTIPAPQAGMTPSYLGRIEVGSDYMLDTGSISNQYYRNGIAWYDVDTEKFLDPNSAVFERGHCYGVQILLKPADGMQFALDAYDYPDVTGYINGNNDSVYVDAYSEDTAHQVVLSTSFYIEEDAEIVPPITKITLWDVDMPVAGEPFDYTPEWDYMEQISPKFTYDAYTLNGLTWIDITDPGNPVKMIAEESVAQAGHTYCLEILVGATNNRIFSVDASGQPTGIVATLNGEVCDLSVVSGAASTHTLKMTYAGCVAEEGLPALAGMTMSLGNSLAANFVISKAQVTGTGYTAEIVKEYADGTTKSVTIPQSQWQKYGEAGYYFTFNGVFAKEMTDLFTVNIYNADGEKVIATYTRTIEGYCYDQLVKEEAKADADAEKLALYADILKYGAAAQVFFENYHSDAMADARLTDAQKAYGASGVTMTDIREKGDGYLGSTLSLKSEISMNFVFASATIDQAAYATISFTNHYGELKEKTVQAADFQIYGTTGKYIVVDGMAVADCDALITVKLFAAGGALLSESVDSVESYIARMSGADALYPAIIKLATSAYNYFH